MGQPTEGALALAVHDGDRGAVDTIVATYQDQMFGYAYRLLNNREDAQEVTQDTFIRAYQTLRSRYTPEQCATLALRPWLFRITRNLALNRRRGGRTAAGASDQTDRLESIPDRGRSPHQCLEEEDDRRRLEAALKKLSRQNREIIVLRFIEECSYAEIAVVVGANEASVRGSAFRALRRLRAILSEQEDV